MWKKIIYIIAIPTLFLLVGCDSTSETISNNQSNVVDLRKQIEVIDLSSMSKEEINSWCDENDINCIYHEEYSNSIQEGDFIEQNLISGTMIHEGDALRIYYSKGKEPTLGEKNAVKTAENYLNAMPFSKSGLIKQLKYEEYTTEEANYAVEHITVDWYEQAVKMAKNYLNAMSFSKKSLISQLEYEGFSYEEALYGVEQNGY